MENLINEQAEQIVIGLLLTHNHTADRISFLHPDDFAFNQHSKLFEIIRERLGRGDDVCTISLANTIRGDDDFKDVGYNSYLHVCAGISSGILNIKTYANIVKDLSSKRKLLEKLKDSIELLENNEGDKPAGKIRDDISDFLAEENKHSNFNKIKTIAEVTKEIITDMESGEEIYPTGFNRLNNSMGGGLKAARVYCFCGRPKGGKTKMLLTIADDMRNNKVPFLFVAAEQGDREIIKQVLGKRLNRSTKAFQEDAKCQEFNHKVYEAGREVDGFYIVNKPRISLSDLRATIETAVYTKGIKGFFLDYIQLVTGNGKNDTIAQWQENVSQTIAELCKKHNIWCVCASQLNKENDVRNGDGIQMAVDWIYGIIQISEEEGGAYRYLKHIAIRDGEARNIGSEADPSFRIAKVGTHMEEV